MATRLSETSYRQSIVEHPPKRSQRIKTYLYNSEEKTFCTRTLCGWLKVILYVLLFTLFVIALGILLVYITYKKFLGRSRAYEDRFSSGYISPGLSFFPNINDQSPIIWYSENRNDESRNPEDYIKAIKDQFDEFDTVLTERQKRKYSVDCEQQNFTGPEPKEICLFNRSNLGNCSVDSYGYDNYQPCFYLKINRIPTWTPDYDFQTLPIDMPESLKKVISQHQYEKMVWVSCEGKRPSDQEHLGPVEYYPFQGFSGYHFPHNTIHKYLTPLVAVRLRNASRNYLISMTCRLWASNFLDNKLLIQLYME